MITATSKRLIGWGQRLIGIEDEDDKAAFADIATSLVLRCAVGVGAILVAAATAGLAVRVFAALSGV